MNGSVTGWIFMTTWDYDLMTGVKIHIKNPSGQSRQHFKATLLRSPSDPSVLANWDWANVEPANPLTLHFDKPVTEIYGRGSMPFILILETQSPDGKMPADVASVEILGIKVNIADYTIVQEEGRCFTALKSSFLEKILGTDSKEWKHYLSSLTSVPALKTRLQASPAYTEGKQNHE
jgi:hypothetical protein